jgi:sirohydrochlorin cobaltochelatase
MAVGPSREVVVLAMHGAPPNDFPEREAAELFGLHARLERTSGPERASLEQRYRELEAKMRTWPRTAENDAFHAGSLQLAARLQEVTGTDVVLGFNEFCAPSLDEALDQAALRRPARVVVVTPMMTRGGEHAEADIPEAIRRAGSRHPEVTMVYAWPFDDRDVARFLADQIARFTQA